MYLSFWEKNRIINFALRQRLRVHLSNGSCHRWGERERVVTASPQRLYGNTGEGGRICQNLNLLRFNLCRYYFASQSHWLSWTVCWAFLHSNKKLVRAEAVSRWPGSVWTPQAANFSLTGWGGSVLLDQCLNLLPECKCVTKECPYLTLWSASNFKELRNAADHQFKTRLADWWRWRRGRERGGGVWGGVVGRTPREFFVLHYLPFILKSQKFPFIKCFISYTLWSSYTQV